MKTELVFVTIKLKPEEAQGILRELYSLESQCNPNKFSEKYPTLENILNLVKLQLKGEPKYARMPTCDRCGD